jgi:hypothetical protein
MIFTLLQFGAIAFMAVCIGRWRASVRRRNAQSWDSIVARLRPECSPRELNDPSFRNEALNATPQQMWERIHGAYGLWAIYQNASVMLEMADYAARNSGSVDPELLATLRSDAMQIRVCVLMALAKYAFSQVNEGICMNAFRAASMYTEMAARMAELLQGNGGKMVPNFVATM